MTRDLTRTIAVTLAVMTFAAPVSATSWNFMVFFVSQSTEVSEQGRSTIGNLIGMYGAKCLVHVDVDGHLDGEEALQTSTTLDFQRAQAVADEIRLQGAHAWTLNIRPLQFTRPLVQTRIGIAEPQNRRVQVVPQREDPLPGCRP